MFSEHSKPRLSIPVYGLYGDKRSIFDVEPLHIESISSRSQLYNWEIDTHTHTNLTQLIVIHSGGADIHLDGTQSRLVGPAMVILPAGSVHGFRFESETQGCVISLSSALASHLSDSQEGLLLSELLQHAGLFQFDAQHPCYQCIRRVESELMEEYQSPRSGRGIMYEALLRMMLVQVHRLGQSNQSPPLHQSQEHQLFDRYQELVETHFRSQKPVKFYAERLYVTESKLKRLSQQMVGLSAFEIIQVRKLMEAQRLLLYTAAPLADIAFQLGFNDIAYFCRFFKKRCRCTPSQFRQREHQISAGPS